jgi:hypothetical protein
MIYYPGWNTTVREITFIGGNDSTDKNLINFMKSNATLISSGDSGEGGDEPEGGDTPSTPTIGPNAQLTEFLTGIADAIREKTGTSDPINPQDFATTITEMQTGGGEDFVAQYINGTLTELVDSEITSVNITAFQGNANIHKVDLPNCTSIVSYAFSGCANLFELNLPKITQISTGTFANCGIVNLSLPACISIAGFNYNPLQTVYLPECKSIIGGAFNHCVNLYSVYLPKCEYMTAGATFGECAITSIDLPLCTQAWSAFYSCEQLQYVNAPRLKSLSADFSHCSNLTTLSFPEVS